MSQNVGVYLVSINSFLLVTNQYNRRMNANVQIVYFTGPFRNNLFDRTPQILSNTESLLALSVEQRDWRVILVEKRLRATLVWKEIFKSEGISTPLALCNHVLEVIYCTWSIRALYGKVLFIKTLTAKEIL